MIIKKLKLENFWSHKNTEVSFDKDFYMILGRIVGKSKSNGSGKSTIARGIAYALYGDASPEIKNTEAIFNDAKSMSVQLDFDLNEVSYKITRNVKRKGSPVIFISVNGGEDVKYKIKEGQETINKILGADFEIYSKTSYFKQGDLNSFSNLTPREAKEVVIKLLQLDAYNEYEDRAKTKVTDINAEINDTQNKLSQLESMIRTEETRSAPVHTQKDLDVENNKLVVLKAGIAKQKEQKDFKDEKILEANKEVMSQGNVISNLKHNIPTLQSRINKLKGLGNKCYTCESELNEEDVQAIITSVENEIIGIGQSLVPANEEYKRLDGILEVVKAIAVDETDYSYQISEVSREIGTIEADLKKQEQDKTKILKYKENLVKGERKLADQTAMLSKYEKLKVAFGKKGIQAFIIDNVIPEIQTTTNEILAGLDTDIRIIIESQRELKSGGKAETLDIKVLTEFGERPYTNYSGGEKTFIDFALRIALAIILTRRSECQIQTLILDEVFGELDTVNKKIISKALRFIANRFNFKKILIISHAEELQDSFDDVIRVVFDGNESKIEEK